MSNYYIIRKKYTNVLSPKELRIQVKKFSHIAIVTQCNTLIIGLRPLEASDVNIRCVTID